MNLQVFRLDIGVLVIIIGFWSPLYYTYNKGTPKMVLVIFKGPLEEVRRRSSDLWTRVRHENTTQSKTIHRTRTSTTERKDPSKPPYTGSNSTRSTKLQAEKHETPHQEQKTNNKPGTLPTAKL